MAGSGSKLIRAFVGYAGWAGGQLESELQQSAWVVHPTTESILVNASNNGTWLDVMKDLGPAYHLLAIAPDDPSSTEPGRVRLRPEPGLSARPRPTISLPPKSSFG